MMKSKKSDYDVKKLELIHYARLQPMEIYQL